MEIILEISHRPYDRANTFGDFLMILYYLIERVRGKLVPRHQVQELTEREPPEVIRYHLAGQVRILLFQTHHRRAGENDLQVLEIIIAIPQLSRPVGILKHLVYQQHLSAFSPKLGGEINECAFRKIEMI